MTSTKEAIGPYDALERAEPGEPMFALLARDHAAPGAITEWTRIRRNRALNAYGGSDKATDKELLAAELKKCANAEAIALEMDDWRKGHEAPAGERAAYQEIIKSAEELAEADRRGQQARAVSSLRECAYHLCEARDDLLDLDKIVEAEAEHITGMLDAINAMADRFEARRAEYADQPALDLGSAAA